MQEAVLIILASIYLFGVSRSVVRIRAKRHCEHNVLFVRRGNYKKKLIKGVCKGCGKYIDKTGDKT